MYATWHRWVSAAACACVAAAGGQADENLVVQVRTAGVASLERTARAYDSVSGSFASRRGSISTGYEDATTVHFAVRSGEILTTTNPVSTRAARDAKPSPLRADDLVSCTNALYAFEVRRPAKKPDFLLDGCELGSDSPPKLRQNAWFYAAPALAAVHLGQVPVVALVQHPTFQLAGCDPSPAAAGRVRVRFACEPTRPVTHAALEGYIGRLSGWFDLDPAESWAVTAYDYTHDSPTSTAKKTRATGVNRFTRGEDGVPVVTFHRDEVCYSEKPEPFSEADGFQILFTAPPAEVFRLTHYNLPEPPGLPAPPPGVPAYVWLLVAGAGLFAVGGTLTWLSRRRAASRGSA